MDFVLARQLREGPAAPRRVPADSARASGTLIEPFEVLYEAEAPLYDTPADLARIYGRIGFQAQVLYSNFVTSLDGVVNLGSTASAGSVISGRNQHDRFLMGLLRACADAVLLGAGTLRATPGHQWTPEHIAPAMAASFAALRRKLGRKPTPRLVLFTASGNLDISHVAVIAGATIVTTARGAERLSGRLPGSCDLIEMGTTRVDVGEALALLRKRGHNVLLTEGGPHLVADFVKARALDESFITISPVIAGRDVEQRLGMVAGVELLPSIQVWSRLVSARRAGDFLFLRYDLRKG